MSISVITRAVRRRAASGLLIAGCAFSLAACDESLLVPDSTMNGARLLAVTPTQLLAQFGVLLDTPIRVRVLDAEGRPVASAPVHYDVIVGAGVFSADSTITNDQGFTEVTFRPLTAGSVVVEARVMQLTGPQQVQFHIFVLNDPTIATTFQKISGDNQSGVVGQELPQPFVVRLLNGDGMPVANVPVTFALQVSRADSAGVSLTRGGSTSGQVVVLSDSSGFARAFGQLGTEVGAYGYTANAVIEVDGVKQNASVLFSATALASSRVALLVPVSGATQSAVLDTIHERDEEDWRGRDPQPMVVQALDRFGNPVANAAITWFVSDGGGQLFVSTTVTDANGLSTNQIRNVTEGSNVVVAFAPGADPVEFTITVELYEPPSEEEPPVPPALVPSLPEENGGG